MRRRPFAFLMMALLAVLSPLLRAGAMCARDAEVGKVAAATAERGHGEHGGHGQPAHERERGAPDATGHCTAAASCASSALGAESAVPAPPSLAHASPATVDEHAPIALVRAPEPPPPRA